jgi:hypothetical protein
VIDLWSQSPAMCLEMANAALEAHKWVQNGCPKPAQLKDFFDGTRFQQDLVPALVERIIAQKKELILPGVFFYDAASLNKKKTKSGSFLRFVPIGFSSLVRSDQTFHIPLAFFNPR